MHNCLSFQIKLSILQNLLTTGLLAPRRVTLQIGLCNLGGGGESYASCLYKVMGGFMGSRRERGG